MKRRDPRDRDRWLCTRIADLIYDKSVGIEGPAKLAMTEIADAIAEAWRRKRA